MLLCVCLCVTVVPVQTPALPKVSLLLLESDLAQASSSRAYCYPADAEQILSALPTLLGPQNPARTAANATPPRTNDFRHFVALRFFPSPTTLAQLGHGASTCLPFCSTRQS